MFLRDDHRLFDVLLKNPAAIRQSFPSPKISTDGSVGSVLGPSHRSIETCSQTCKVIEERLMELNHGFCIENRTDAQKHSSHKETFKSISEPPAAPCNSSAVPLPCNDPQLVDLPLDSTALPNQCKRSETPPLLNVFHEAPLPEREPDKLTCASPVIKPNTPPIAISSPKPTIDQKVLGVCPIAGDPSAEQLYSGIKRELETLEGLQEAILQAQNLEASAKTRDLQEENRMLTKLLELSRGVQRIARPPPLNFPTASALGFDPYSVLGEPFNPIHTDTGAQANPPQFCGCPWCCPIIAAPACGCPLCEASPQELGIPVAEMPQTGPDTQFTKTCPEKVNTGTDAPEFEKLPSRHSEPRPITVVAWRAPSDDHGVLRKLRRHIRAKDKVKGRPGTTYDLDREYRRRRRYDSSDSDRPSRFRHSSEDWTPHHHHHSEDHRHPHASFHFPRDGSYSPRAGQRSSPESSPRHYDHRHHRGEAAAPSHSHPHHHDHHDLHHKSVTPDLQRSTDGEVQRSVSSVSFAGDIRAEAAHERSHHRRRRSSSHSNGSPTPRGGSRKPAATKPFVPEKGKGRQLHPLIPVVDVSVASSTASSRSSSSSSFRRRPSPRAQTRRRSSESVPSSVAYSDSFESVDDESEGTYKRGSHNTSRRESIAESVAESIASTTLSSSRSSNRKTVAKKPSIRRRRSSAASSSIAAFQQAAPAIVPLANQRQTRGVVRAGAVIRR